MVFSLAMRKTLSGDIQQRLDEIGKELVTHSVAVRDSLVVDEGKRAVLMDVGRLKAIQELSRGLIELAQDFPYEKGEVLSYIRGGRE